MIAQQHDSGRRSEKGQSPLLRAGTNWGQSCLDLCALFALSLFMMACGGSERRVETGPLKTTLSERYIAAIPLSEQRAIILSEDDLALARRESARARAEYEQSATSLRVALYQKKRADYGKRAAQAQLQSAQNRANLQDARLAKVALDLAAADEEAAAAKLSEEKANRAYLKAELDYRLAFMRAMEASYELEKARLAAAHHIEPQGFSLQEYERQYDSRMAQANKAQMRASDKRMAASSAHARWIALKNGSRGVQRENGAPPKGRPAEPGDEARQPRR